MVNDRTTKQTRSPDNLDLVLKVENELVDLHVKVADPVLKVATFLCGRVHLLHDSVLALALVPA